MKDNDEYLKQRLNQWIDENSQFNRLQPTELALRVRKSQSARKRRERNFAVTVVLLLVGVGAFRLAWRSPAERSLTVSDGNFTQPGAVNEAIHNRHATHSEQVRSVRLDELNTEIEKSQERIEQLSLSLRIQQVIADANRLLQEYERRDLREEQASQWLVTTFRKLDRPNDL